jgi:DNA-directed RNA polymerase specialized sigma subunit
LGRVIRAVDIYRENIIRLINDVESLEQRRGEIGDVLKPLMVKLNSNESAVVNLRYSTGISLREMDKQFHYAVDTCYKIHWRSLKKMIFS